MNQSISATNEVALSDARVHALAGSLHGYKASTEGNIVSKVMVSETSKFIVVSLVRNPDGEAKTCETWCRIVKTTYQPKHGVFLHAGTVLRGNSRIETMGLLFNSAQWVGELKFLEVGYNASIPSVKDA